MEKNRFFGVGEPLIQRQRDQGIDAAAYLALVAGLGCTAFRSWMHITEILDDPSTLDQQWQSYNDPKGGGGVDRLNVYLSLANFLWSALVRLKDTNLI